MSIVNSENPKTIYCSGKCREVREGVRVSVELRPLYSVEPAPVIELIGILSDGSAPSLQSSAHGHRR